MEFLGVHDDCGMEDGDEDNVAWRDDASYSCMNTGWRLVGFMLA